MELYTDMKYSDCGCSGRCRKVSGNQNQSVSMKVRWLSIRLTELIIACVDQ